MMAGLARILLLVSIVVFGVVGRATAAILVPAGLTPGDQYHLVFVSSTANDANFGGIAGAYVQALADAAGIGVTEGVTWQAILSDSTTSALSRFNPTAPIYNMNGNRVAVNGPALWGTTALNLENPISFDENGAGSTTILVEVWTGTAPNGLWGSSDSDWLASSAGTFATAGSSIDVTTNWINGGGSPAENVPLSLFATSDLLTVPVPEPSALVIAMLGLSSSPYSVGDAVTGSRGNLNRRAEAFCRIRDQGGLLWAGMLNACGVGNIGIKAR